MRNRLPTTALKEGETPYERWYGRIPDVSHFRVFGCMAYAHVPDYERRKLDAKSKKPESDFGQKLVMTTEPHPKSMEVKQNANTTAKDEEEVAEIRRSEREEERQELRRSERTRKTPVRYGYDEFADTATYRERHVAYHLIEVDEPSTIQEAKSGDHAAEWKVVTDAEYNSLIENKTWKLVELPPFLNGKLDEEIYMQQPEGYLKPAEEHLVCKLEKSLYGLKLSSRCWNKAFRKGVEKVGFTQASADPCVFIRKEDRLTIIAIHVDDLMILAENILEMQRLKDSLKLQFKMKDMGELHYYLEVCNVQDKERKQVYIHQGQYIEKMLKKFGQTAVKSVSTPADLNVKLQKEDGVSRPVDTIRYQSIVGSLLYAAIRRSSVQILHKVT